MIPKSTYFWDQVFNECQSFESDGLKRNRMKFLDLRTVTVHTYVTVHLQNLVFETEILVVGH